MAPNAFLRLFPSDPKEEANGHPLIPEKFLLFAKVQSRDHSGCPAFSRARLIITISRHRYKVAPLELRGDQQSLEPFCANDGYYRYCSSLSQFEITSIQIKPYNFKVARGCPHMNTTLTCQSDDWFKITTGHVMGSNWSTESVYVMGDFLFVNQEGTSMLGTWSVHDQYMYMQRGDRSS